MISSNIPHLQRRRYYTTHIGVALLISLVAFACGEEKENDSSAASAAATIIQSQATSVNGVECTGHTISAPRYVGCAGGWHEFEADHYLPSNGCDWSKYTYAIAGMDFNWYQNGSYYDKQYASARYDKTYGSKPVRTNKIGCAATGVSTSTISTGCKCWK